jgi:hypothetical protein
VNCFTPSPVSSINVVKWLVGAEGHGVHLRCLLDKEGKVARDVEGVETAAAAVPKLWQLVGADLDAIA